MRLARQAWGVRRVLNPAQFSVLEPDVAFDDFGRGGETQQRGVALGDRAVLLGPGRGPLQRACGECGAGGPKRFEERASFDLAGGKRPVAIDAGLPRGEQGAVGRLGCVQHARTASIDGSCSSGCMNFKTTNFRRRRFHLPPGSQHERPHVYSSEDDRKRINS